MNIVWRKYFSFVFFSLFLDPFYFDFSFFLSLVLLKLEINLMERYRNLTWLDLKERVT